MRQTKVMSVFDGVEMQKHFLYITKQAEEAAFNAMFPNSNCDNEMEEFMREIKNMPKLKTMIQDMILYSISNIDWDSSIMMAIENNR